MCDTGKIGLIPPTATFETLKVQPDEVLVIKIDTRYYDLASQCNLSRDCKPVTCGN